MEAVKEGAKNLLGATIRGGLSFCYLFGIFSGLGHTGHQLQAWDKLDIRHLQNLYETMPHCVEAIVESGIHHIR